MVSGLFAQLKILRQFYMIEWLGLLYVLGPLELQLLIYPGLFKLLGTLFLRNSSCTEFQVGLSDLVIHFSVIDGFGRF